MERGHPDRDNIGVYMRKPRRRFAAGGRARSCPRSASVRLTGKSCEPADPAVTLTMDGPDPARPGEDPPALVPLYPTARTLTALRSYLRRVVLASGTRGPDREDVIAECIAGAWWSIQRGRFLVEPGVDPEAALRRWLAGVAWRQAARERERAHHRREVLTPAPWAMAREQEEAASIDPVEQLFAREGLRALARLQAHQRALLLRAAGASLAEIAAALGVARPTVANRIASARAALAALMDPKEEPGVIGA
ncbi:MAG: helix-turn-helix domain-containing protein [Polyangiaceae bacterium]|nr:helix-turn-helix domain-containing protein [Polyangiaceae bacterium]